MLNKKFDAESTTLFEKSEILFELFSVNSMEADIFGTASTKSIYNPLNVKIMVTEATAA